MKRLKQILFLFAITLSFIFIKDNVYAATSGNLNSDGSTTEATWSYNTSTKKMTITSKVNDMWVSTYIDDDRFSDFNTYINQATEISLAGKFNYVDYGISYLPNLITISCTNPIISIEDGALEECPKLKNLNFTYNNAKIDTSFDGCTSLTNLSFNNISSISAYFNEGLQDTLQTLYIGNISEDCEFDFSYMDKLTSITFENITGECDADLNNCSKLSKITFKNNIEGFQLDYLYLYDCDNLKTIDFINCLCDINSYGTFLDDFYDEQIRPEVNIIINENLEIEEDAEIRGLEWTKYLSDDIEANLIIENISTNCDFSNLMDSFSSSGSHVISGIGGVGSTTPSYNYHIKSLTIQNIMADEIIFDDLLYRCSSLKEITLSNVYNCYSEKNEYFDSAFAYCTALNKVTMDNSITIIDTNMFIGCTGLASIDLSNVGIIRERAFKNSGLSNIDSWLTNDDNIYYMPSIGSEAFYNCPFTNVVLTCDYDIGSNAFYNTKHISWTDNTNVYSSDFYGALQDHDYVELEEQYKKSGSIENGCKYTYCDTCKCYVTKQYLIRFENISHGHNETSFGNPEDDINSGYVDENAVILFNIIPDTGYSITGYTATNEEDIEIDINTAQITVDNAYVITTNIIPNSDTPYTVNHYIMKTDGTYIDVPDEIETKKGITNTVITIPAHKKSSIEVTNGIIFDIDKINDSEITINGDGSTEINLYYKRMPYTVTFEKGLGIDIVPENTTYLYGADVYVYTLELLDNYMFNCWSGDFESTKANISFKMPAKDITLKANGKKILNTTDTYEINGYYYKVVIDENGIAVLTLIGSVAPANDTEVTSLTVENEVEIEGNILPVTSVGENAFKDYQYLENVTLGENVSTLGSGAFENCSSLSTVTAKNPNLTYDDTTFAGCDNYNNTTDNTTDSTNNENTNTDNKNDSNLSDSNPNLIGTKFTYKKLKYKILSNNTVAIIGSSSKKITKLTIPKTVKYNNKSYRVVKISSKAFKGYSKLQKVTIGNNITTIEKEAFSGCKKLSTITIGKNVTKINSKAFYKCSKLKKITIKSSKLKTIGSKAISGINKKATIKVPKKQLKTYKKLFKSKTGFKKTMKIKK